MIYILFFTGCATAPSKPMPAQGMPGIYHRVGKGQTLWRISKIYNVELDELVRLNKISDAALIETGQLVFIPNRKIQQTKNPGFISDDFIWPVKGKVIAVFGDSFNNTINKGINIQPSRSLEVSASRGGQVVFYAESFGSFGKTVILDHKDGFSTVYARNSEVYVKLGDVVQRGAVIAKAGFAGRNRLTYLHFEIRKGHTPQNPFYYLPH